MRGQFELPPPGRLEPRDEFPPTTNPVLIDQEPADWPEPGGFAPVHSDPLDEILPQEEIDRATEVVLNDPGVNEVLGGDRPVGGPPSIVEPKDANEPPLIVYYLYSCASGNTAEVVVDASTMTIASIATMPIQPPLTRAELDTAIDLAGRELGLVYSADLVGRAMGITVEDPAHPMFGHRLADVRIGNPEQRLPRFFATVDLCDGVVLDAGDVQ